MEMENKSDNKFPVEEDFNGKCIWVLRRFVELMNQTNHLRIFEANNDNMKEGGIKRHDLVVYDLSIKALAGRLVVVSVNDVTRVRRLGSGASPWKFVLEHKESPAYVQKPTDKVEFHGVVIATIKGYSFHFR